MRLWGRFEAALAELEAETRQKMANRTDALEQTIGTLRQQATRDSLTGLFNRRFLDQYIAVLETVARGYLVEGKRFMTIAVGCTGGKHRSVAMAEEIAARLTREGIDTRPMHRDLGRE